MWFRWLLMIGKNRWILIEKKPIERGITLVLNRGIDRRMRKKETQLDPLAKAWLNGLAVLLGRNHPLELVPHSASGEAMPQVRVRLLAIDDDGSLVVERPRGAGATEGLRLATEVVVYLIDGQSRMKAKSRVTGIEKHQLNDQQKVPAVRLAPPLGVNSAQRRECYRLSTGHLDLMPVRLTALVPIPNFEGWDARALDISDRGIGLGLPIGFEDAKPLDGRSVNLKVNLGSDQDPLTFDVQARVVRVFSAEDGRACLGLIYEHKSLQQQRAAQQLIQAFSMEQQRKELRRLRRTG